MHFGSGQRSRLRLDVVGKRRAGPRELFDELRFQWKLSEEFSSEPVFNSTASQAGDGPVGFAYFWPDKSRLPAGQRRLILWTNA
jgi:hypothetical protein